MLKYGALLASLVIPMSAAAQEVKARFIVISAGEGRQVVPQEWSEAVVAAGLGEVTRTTIDTDFYAIDAAVEAAKSDNSTVAFFMTANLPTTDDADYAKILQGFLAPKPEQPLLDGLYAMMQQPGCALIRKPLTGQEFIHTNTIITKNDPAARVACYQAVMAYTMDNLSQFGSRTPFHEQVDPNAVALQANLPPMAIKSQALIDPAARVQGQGPVRRGNNVYKPGEKMDFHANILNVGRFNPGTAQARFEIQLDLAVTREDTGETETLEKVHVYKGESTHSIPVADDYFENFVTAGFSLQDPGAYLVELVLTDLSRPGEDGTTLRVPYDVIVAE